MKTIKSLILICPLIASCQNSQKKIAQTSEFKRIFFTKKIDSILKSFIVENHSSDKLNEIYFDRVYPHYTIITITSTKKDVLYLEMQHPMNYSLVGADTVWSYSGIENYLLNDSNVKFNYYNGGFDNRWTIVDSMGVITVNQNGGMPFLPLPTQIW